MGPTLPKLPFPSTLWNIRWFMVRCARGTVGVTGAGLKPSPALPAAINTHLQQWIKYIKKPECEDVCKLVQQTKKQQQLCTTTVVPKIIHVKNP